MATLVGSSGAFAQVNLPEKTADLPGVKLHYVDSGGTGTPVIFLHAATGSSEVWEHQIKAVTGAGYRFIAYDRRGWGSSMPDPAGPAGTAADDLENFVKYLKIDRFHLVGTAAGAIVGVDYALSYPQRLKSMVVSTTIAGIVDEDFQELGRRIRPPQFDALPPEMKEVGPEYRAANKEGTERWIEFEKRSRIQGVKMAPQTSKNRVTAALFETMPMPLLFIAGGCDLYAPAAVMHKFADRAKGARFLSIPDVGHSAYWEAPDVFNKAVLDFLKEHDRN